VTASSGRGWAEGRGGRLSVLALSDSSGLRGRRGAGGMKSDLDGRGWRELAIALAPRGGGDYWRIRARCSSISDRM